ncbi:MAG: trehalose-6-phosphate synthase [Deltaproteobacteria bacterium]|nr:trehalose-6-phosphate synthase [Deltaproteobacteria bacterium]
MQKTLIKLLFPIVGLLFAGLILFSYLRVTRERTQLIDDLDRRARVIAKSLSIGAMRAIRNPPTPDEEDLAERLSGQGRTMGIMVCETDGKLVARSAALADLKTCEDPEVQEVITDQKEKVLIRDEKGRTLHTLIFPLKTRSGDFVGSLAVVHEASYINKRIMSAVTWTTLTLAVLAIFISALTYFLSRRSFQRSVQQVLSWMASTKEPSESLPPPTESLLKPVTREVEKMAARLRAAKETAREVSEDRQASDLWTPARLKAHAVTHFGEKPLIVVSNREPYMHVKEQGRHKVIVPASGLVTSLDPVLRATSGLWIAHGAGDGDRDTVDHEDKVLVPPEAPSYTLKRVWLNREEEEGYYYGFSNEALWPLCHLTHHRPEFEEKDWQTYREVNEKFADAVVREFGKTRPFVLVQDYHFTLLPKLIRERRPDAIIGLFWHIPWPTPELFQVCPWKREILEGMLGANFVGFHLQSYCNNFLDTVNSLLPVRVEWDRFAVLHNQGTTLVKPFPISIQPWGERMISTEEEFQQKSLGLREQLELGNTRIVISVDRLDYTKGIPERLGAINRFFEKYPAYKTKVSFVQLGAPSRIHIPRYRDFVTEVEKLVDEVNWKHAEGSWKPVIFFKAHHDPKTVYTFLRMADVCIVSSLADGMNLVAKEFVAAREKGDGVLLLSEFTGAAREFQEAVQFNPYARADFAEAIRIALEMPLDEQQRRMTRLKVLVVENNVYKWAASLITEMAQTTEEVSAQKTDSVSRTADVSSI